LDANGPKKLLIGSTPPSDSGEKSRGLKKSMGNENGIPYDIFICVAPKNPREGKSLNLKKSDRRKEGVTQTLKTQ